MLLEAFVIGFARLGHRPVPRACAREGRCEALFRALGLGLPRAETVFATRTVVVSLLVGTIVTVIAGLFPAIRATRVPPIAAVREGATLPKGALLALHAVHRDRADRRSRSSLLGYAMFADDVDTADAAALDRGRRAAAVRRGRDDLVAARAPARLGRRPARTAIGGAAGGARAAQRDPQSGPHRRDRGGADDRRSRSSRSSPMLANGMKASNRDAIEDQITADFIITSQDGYTPFVAGAGDAAGDAGRAES